MSYRKISVKCDRCGRMDEYSCITHILKVTLIDLFQFSRYLDLCAGCKKEMQANHDAFMDAKPEPQPEKPLPWYRRMFA